MTHIKENFRFRFCFPSVWTGLKNTVVLTNNELTIFGGATRIPRKGRQCYNFPTPTPPKKSMKLKKSFLCGSATEFFLPLCKNMICQFSLQQWSSINLWFIAKFLRFHNWILILQSLRNCNQPSCCLITNFYIEKFTLSPLHGYFLTWIHYTCIYETKNSSMYRSDMFFVFV